MNVRHLLVGATATAVALSLLTLPGSAATATYRSLSMKVPRSVVIGEDIALSGKLSKTPAGAEISLEHLDGSAWTQITTVELTSEGTFATTVPSPVVEGSHRYRAAIGATDTLRAATSREMKVKVLKPITITIAATPHSPAAGQQLTINGTASPARARTRVVLQHKVGTTWRQVKSASVDEAGHFSVPRTRGEAAEVFRAVKRADGYYAAGTSNELLVPKPGPDLDPDSDDETDPPDDDGETVPGEHSEDWTDLAGVSSAGVTVANHRLYSTGALDKHGFVKAIDVPASSIWRYQQLIYNKADGSPSPDVRLGVSCGAATTGFSDTDPDAVGWQLHFDTRTRSTFKGSGLSSVPIHQKEIAGPNLGNDLDGTFLFTIDADESWVSFALTRVGAPREIATFKLSRAELAREGKTISKIYASINDGRAQSGSSLSPFILQEGTLRPATNRTVGGQLIEGVAQHVINTSENETSPMSWYVSLPPGFHEHSPLVVHLPQSLTGDGDDFWTDVRYQPVTTALTNAGYALASSSDIRDRFGNQVELDNYRALHDWVMEHYGADRDVFLFSTSMGTVGAINLTGRGMLDARATATVGFAGGFDWLWNAMSGTKRTNIRAAYNFSGLPTPDQLHQYTAGYDPLLSFVGSPVFAGKGFRFYTSAGDPTTPADLSEQMAEIVGAAGATEAGVVMAGGGHLDSSQFQGADLVSFYDRHRTR
jgi:hypothetical protein